MSRLTGSRIARLGPVAVLFLAAPAAQAGIDWHPYGGVQVEHNSNVYAFANSQQAQAINGDSQLGDTDEQYFVGTDASYQWGRQQFNATLEGRRFTYDHFSNLDHNEYLVHGEDDWKLGSIFDGTLDYKQHRYQQSLRNLSSLCVASSSSGACAANSAFERDMTASANANVTPEWRIETQAQIYKLQSPLPDDPQFQLGQHTYDLGLNYIGLARLKAGIKGEYQTGTYAGESADRYHQLGLMATAHYEITGVSSLNAEAGYSKRRDVLADGQSLNGFTGRIDYTRQISAKTDFTIGLFRSLQSYIGGATADYSSGLTADFNWRATSRITASAHYDWTRDRFAQTAPGTTNSSVFSGSSDHVQDARIDVSYQPLDWLQLGPYFEFQHRSSNVPVSVDQVGLTPYNADIFGIKLEARLP